MHIRMKPVETAPAGWVAKLIASGIKATYHNERFGRTAWLFKKDDEAVQAVQDPTRVLATPLSELTPVQLSIIQMVEASGVARVVPRRTSDEATHV